jgi:hypothetical protein
MDEELVQFARCQAKHDGKSVSGMFSDFLSARRAQPDGQATSSVSGTVGSLKAYCINDSKW